MRTQTLDISLDKNLLGLVKGKRVAIVGPAPHIINKGLGPLIDEYDIICRINFPGPGEELYNDLGSRTDIMIHNFGTPWLDDLRWHINSHPIMFNNLHLLVSLAIKSDHSEQNYLSWPDSYEGGVLRNINSMNTNNIPSYWIGVKDYKKLYSAMGGIEFNMGAGGIALLLQYPVSELFITGFSFHKESPRPYEEFYHKGHASPSLVNSKYNGGSSVMGGSTHGREAIIKQINFFTKLSKSFKKTLKIDSYLDNLLKLNHPNILNI